MGSFFIAVGGSGQHVALALVDQIALAHHVYKRSLDPFEFLVLDRDIATGGGDTRKTAWQLTQEQLDALQRADIGAPSSWKKDRKSVV